MKWRRVFRRFVLWLRLVFTPSARVAVVPGDTCAHDVDPEVALRRLVQATPDPQRFASELAQLAGCQGCSTAVLCEAVYLLAGIAMADQPDVDEPLSCTCERPTAPEVTAMALVLSTAAHNGDAFADMFHRVSACKQCTFNMVAALACGNVRVLDEVRPGWEELVAERLLEAIDAEGGSA